MTTDILLEAYCRERKIYQEQAKKRKAYDEFWASDNCRDTPIHERPPYAKAPNKSRLKRLAVMLRQAMIAEEKELMM